LTSSSTADELQSLKFPKYIALSAHQTLPSDSSNAVELCIKAGDLEYSRDGAALNPYCVFEWRGKRYQTTLNAVTNKTSEDLGKSFCLPYDADVDPATITVSIYDAPPLIGTVELELKRAAADVSEQWYDVEGEGSGKIGVRLQRATAQEVVDEGLQQRVVPVTTPYEAAPSSVGSSFASFVRVHVFPRRWIPADQRRTTETSPLLWRTFAVPELQPRLWKQITFPPPLDGKSIGMSHDAASFEVSNSLELVDSTPVKHDGRFVSTSFQNTPSTASFQNTPSTTDVSAKHFAHNMNDNYEDMLKGRAHRPRDFTSPL